MIFSIKNEEIKTINESESVSFPKYTSQLMNWANQNAQGTRARVVGQLSELFPKYLSQAEKISINDWRGWYSGQYPNAILEATDKIYSQLNKLKEAINLIDKDMVKNWVEDLVITKTFNGLYFQKAILAKISELNGEPYRLAGPEEESAGIDGYVGDKAYSIKPDSYKTKGWLPETIDVTLVYYKKKKNGLMIEVQE